MAYKGMAPANSKVRTIRMLPADVRRIERVQKGISRKFGFKITWDEAARRSLREGASKLLLEMRAG